MPSHFGFSICRNETRTNKQMGLSQEDAGRRSLFVIVLPLYYTSNHSIRSNHPSHRNALLPHTCLSHLLTPPIPNGAVRHRPYQPPHPHPLSHHLCTLSLSILPIVSPTHLLTSKSVTTQLGDSSQQPGSHSQHTHTHTQAQSTSNWEKQTQTSM